MKPLTSREWAAVWFSRSKRHGTERYLLRGVEGNVLTFRTRALARKYIAGAYAYIARRSDLRGEPYGWRLPRAVRVRIVEARP